MIWLVGCNGMLGHQLSLELAGAGLEWVGTDREVSILDQTALSNFAQSRPIDWIINCAAYTAVDKAEDEPDLAYAINADGPAELATVARKIGSSLLHLSTDYVFDGKGIALPGQGLRPYREDDPISPQSVYGATKAAGEQSVRNGLEKHIILRTAWLYGQFGPNFVFTMLRLMRQKTGFGVVADQFGSPTWAKDLAKAIVAIISKAKPNYGTYQFSGSGVISWHDFAMEIHRQARACGILERDCGIEKLESHQYPAKATRPAWSVLDKSAIQSNFDIQIRDWKASLSEFMAEISPIWQSFSYINPRE